MDNEDSQSQNNNSLPKTNGDNTPVNNSLINEKLDKREDKQKGALDELAKAIEDERGIKSEQKPNPVSSVPANLPTGDKLKESLPKPSLVETPKIVPQNQKVGQIHEQIQKPAQNPSNTYPTNKIASGIPGIKANAPQISKNPEAPKIKTPLSNNPFNLKEKETVPSGGPSTSPSNNFSYLGEAHADFKKEGEKNNETNSGYRQNPKLRPLRTLKGDLAQTARNQNESMTSIALSAHKKRAGEIEKPASSSETKYYVRSETRENLQMKDGLKVPFFRNSIFIIVSILLIGIGGFSIYSIFFAKSISETPIPIDEPSSIVLYDTFKTIAFSRSNTFISEIKAGQNILPQNNGAIFYTDIVGGSTEEILNFLFPQIPSSLSRISRTPIAIGYFNGDLGKSFFLVTSVNDFSQAFSGMLNWEPNMVFDFSDLFIEKIGGKTYWFIDGVLENRDIRELVDEQGRSFIVYGFIDRETLIIAENREAFNSITENILIKRTVR